jgi:hypothetical protein
MRCWCGPSGAHETASGALAHRRCAYFWTSPHTSVVSLQVRRTMVDPCVRCGTGWPGSNPGILTARSPSTWASLRVSGLGPGRQAWEIRRAAGRPPMARTGFRTASGSRHRGSVGGRPRYGDKAACPPAPSDSASLETPGGARRPGLYGGTSARLAVSPYAPTY